MDLLLSKLGIDWKLLIAQLVNFLIVFFVLKKFVYKPILATLDKRTAKIEKGLEDAQAANKRLKEITEKEKTVLAQAKKEAQQIIKSSEEQAKANAVSIVLEARNQSEKLLVSAKNQIEQEKNKMLSEVKGEIASLVVLATEKIIGEKLDKEKDRELIEKSIKTA